uniref:Interferon-induced very large GTPase 1-like n=1 Tax=Erpetoichthys calabaricus TaxID=27687 RepID=A0A8C4S947_ERPCA
MVAESNDQELENKEELQQRLADAGLYPTYWMPKLKEKIGITTVQALKYVTRDDYQKMKFFCNHPWEKRALRNVFNLAERKQFVCDQWDEDIKETKKSQKEGRKQKYPSQKSVEHETNTTMSEEDIHENVQEQTDSSKASSQSNETELYKMILTSASDGLALKGILKTENLKDYIGKREHLVRAPKSFIFTKLELQTICEQYEFSSYDSKWTFEKLMESMGRSSVCSVKHFDSNLSLNPPLGLKNSESRYYCKMKYVYLPLASISFCLKDLFLANAAMTELQSIESHLTRAADQELITKKIQQFFTRFGSHANQGPLHFGGIFWWKASCEGFQTEEEEDVKRIVTETLNDNTEEEFSEADLSHSSGVDTKKKSRSAKGGRNESLKEKVVFSVLKTGGLPEANRLIQWKTALTSNSHTWCVIDRGLELIPVWEIILENHSNDFKNLLELSNTLENVHKALTEVKRRSFLGEPVSNTMREVKGFLHNITFWNTSNSDSHLLELVELKKKLCQQREYYDVWLNKCLRDPTLQNFLLQITLVQTNFPHEKAESLRMLMQQLLLPDIDKIDNFPEKPFIMTWLSKSKNAPADKDLNLSDFLFTLDNAKQNIQKASPEKRLKETTEELNKITLSLYNVCESLSMKNQTEELSLLLSVVTSVGYSEENKAFVNQIGFQDIVFMHNELQKDHETYSRLKCESVAKAQAFVIVTGLRVTPESKKVTPEKKNQRLQILQIHLKEFLSEDISELLHSYDNRQMALEELEKKLNAIAEEINLGTNKDAEVRSDPPCQMLIKRLGLEKHYPKKLSLSDILIIDKLSIKEGQPSSEQELPLFFLHKLFITDYRAREIFFSNKGKEINPSKNLNNETYTENIDSFFDEDSTADENMSDDTSSIHFMDIQMAIYHCADMLFWQYLTSKLSFCQYALPLVIPNPFTGETEFPLWSFRPIKKSWKCVEISCDKKDSYKCRSGNVCRTPVQVVSFMRFGRCSSSKSQILNGLMNNQKHNIFYHRDCKGSTSNLILMNGVIEISWYCPGGKDDDLFSDCVAFMNLRGDAREHDKQLEFLLEVSTVIVLVLTDSDQKEIDNALLKRFLLSPKPLMCLYSDKRNVSKGNHETKVKIPLQQRNQAELFEELRETIQLFLKKSKMSISIEGCANVARKYHFKVDEDNEACKEARTMADTLVRPLKEKALTEIKDEYFPLQGKLWHEWCKKNKEHSRLQSQENQTIEQTKAKIETEKEKIRKDQRNKAVPLNSVIKSFLSNLKTGPRQRKLLFLKWLGIFLDDLTLVKLTNLEREHSEKWLKLQELKNKHMNCKPLENELEILSTKIMASSFGLEHFLREVGQIYEACQPVQNELCSSLSELAADIMISGYPIELVDGDAAHAAVTWVSSVLEKVKQKLGDKRIFVLSVLGIQSTGKSTLLNAMFGLQFAVSAGRCTRGAFMQLIKVKEEELQELNFDYMLVVDTEGLRALELGNKSTLNHDNELATFVIGIGNVTIINIFGENPSDMQDILQISVQAFLRMNKVKLSPSCIFVHQNVGEITAGEKNIEGKRRLEERLDVMTQNAAKQEVCNVTRFKDVIKFDINKHVHYFTHLWEGNPPMAPPNPSYSENVLKLKREILSVAAYERVLTISEFKARFNDLWSALLDEDFVFSFKNTIEIAAYRALEERYADWSWGLRSHMLETENQLRNMIENKTLENMESLCLEEKIQEKYEELTNQMEHYFSNDKDKDIVIQWKARIEINFENLKKDLIKTSERKLSDLLQMKQSVRKLDEEKGKYEDELMKKSQELAKQLKHKALEGKELKEAFEKMWSEWEMRVRKESPPHVPPNIEADSEKILSKYFDSKLILSSKKDKSYTKILDVNDYSRYINKKRALFLRYDFSHEDQQLMKNLTYEIITKINNYVKEKETAKVDYDQNYIHEIIKMIMDNVKSCEIKQERFEIKKEYQTDVALFSCAETTPKFQEMNHNFQKANDPLEHLGGLKMEYFKCFEVTCKGTTTDVVLAETVVKRLKAAIQQAVYDRCLLTTTDIIKCNNPAFNGNRSNLENHILLSLVEKNDFNEFMQYIESPKQHFAKFIETRVDAHFSDKNEEIRNMCKEFVETFKKIVESAMINSTENLESDNAKVEIWLDRFCKELNGQIVFSKYDVGAFKSQNINNTVFFKESVTAFLEEAKNELKSSFNNTISMDITEFRQQPHEILTEQMSGCWEQCPFCLAICETTIPNHEGDHSVRFHRPRAVKGGSWYRTDQFDTDICSTLVESDFSYMNPEGKWIPFKKYRSGGPKYEKWNITPERELQPIWKWFVCHFKSQLENHYKLKFKDIPEPWEKITKQVVIEFLKSK